MAVGLEWWVHRDEAATEYPESNPHRWWRRGVIVKVRRGGRLELEEEPRKGRAGPACSSVTEDRFAVEIDDEATEASESESEKEVEEPKEKEKDGPKELLDFAGHFQQVQAKATRGGCFKAGFRNRGVDGVLPPTLFSRPCCPSSFSLCVPLLASVALSPLLGRGCAEAGGEDGRRSGDAGAQGRQGRQGQALPASPRARGASASLPGGSNTRLEKELGKEKRSRSGSRISRLSDPDPGFKPMTKITDLVRGGTGSGPGRRSSPALGLGRARNVLARKLWRCSGA